MCGRSSCAATAVRGLVAMPRGSSPCRRVSGSTSSQPCSAAVLRFPRAVHVLNLGYASFNVTMTVGWLLVLFGRRDPAYHGLRRACQGAFVAAQPVFLLFPTAPPRALEGFVHTMSEVSGFDLEHRVLVRLYNPVAAMPSMHVAFAVLTGAAIAERTESRVVKTAAYAYPPFVSLVVAATGNHYVLEAGSWPFPLSPSGTGPGDVSVRLAPARAGRAGASRERGGLAAAEFGHSTGSEIGGG